MNADPKSIAVAAAPVEATLPTARNPAQNTSDAQTETHTQSAILAVWRDMFGDPAIGPDDDFFELGGDSLFAVRIATRLSEVLTAEIPTAVMFEGRTVSGVANLLASFETNSPPTNARSAPTATATAKPATTAPRPSREQGVL